MHLNSKYLQKTISACFYLLAIAPLLIGKNLYFPFITLKTFYLRALIEIMFAVFAYLYLTAKDVRLNRSLPFYAFSAWMIALFASSIFGEDPIISFFSDYERSWGVLTLFHFYLLFVVASSVIEERVWMRFFKFSVFISLLVSFYGFAQRAGASWVTESGIDRISSTLGNPVYLAIYLLFNIAFALIIMARRPRSWINLYYIGAIIVNLTAFSYAAIRGASIGLFAGLILASLVYIFFSPSRRVKISSAAVLGALFLVSIFLFLNRDSELIAKWPYLNRIISISLEGNTAQTRFIGWRAGLKGFRDRPFLGFGPENYGVPFNKYFESKFYNLAPTETFFDRAHNVSIDVLATTGAVGFAAYYSIFATFIILVWRLFKEDKINKNLFIIGIATPIAYFIHNQFVFDDLISLTMFTVFAAYYAKLSFAEKERQAAVIPQSAHVASALAITAVTLAAIWIFNYAPYLANAATGVGAASDNINVSFDSFKKALNYGTFQSQDIKLAFADKVLQFAQLGANRDKLKEAEDLAIGELEKEIERNPNDVFLGVKLLSLYNVKGIVTNTKEPLEKAEKFGQKMIESSPERLQLYYLLSETEIFLGKPQEAVELLKKALAYNSGYRDTYWFLGRAYIDAGDAQQGLENLKSAIDKGFRGITSGPIVASAQKLLNKKEFKAVEQIYELLLPYTSDAQLYAMLAAIEVELGKKDKAIDYALKAAELDPQNYEKEARQFIESLKTNKP